MSAQADPAARAAARLLLALGRGQDDDRAAARRTGSRAHPVGLGDDPPAAAGRGRRARLLVHRPARLRRDGGAGRAVGACARVRQLLRHAAPADRRGARRRARHRRRSRLAGNPAAHAARSARISSLSLCCRRASPRSNSGCAPALRTAPPTVAARMAKSAEEMQPLARIRLCDRQRHGRGQRRRGPSHRHRRTAAPRPADSASPSSSTACARAERCGRERPG